MVRRKWSWAPGDLVMLAAEIIAAIILLHIIFVLLGTNPNNDIVRTVGHWAGWLGTWFEDMFQPADKKAEIALNYGMAAVFFLVVGAVLKRAIDRL